MRQEQIDQRKTLEFIKQKQLTIQDLEAEIKQAQQRYLDGYAIPVGTLVEFNEKRPVLKGLRFHVTDIEIYEDLDLRYNLRKPKKDGSPALRGQTYYYVPDSDFFVVEEDLIY